MQAYFSGEKAFNFSCTRRLCFWVRFGRLDSKAGLKAKVTWGEAKDHVTACYILAYFSDETTFHISCSRQFFGFETKDQQGGDKDQVVESGKERLFTLPPPLSRSLSRLLWLVHKKWRERILVLPCRLKDRLKDILMSSHAPLRLEFYVKLNLSKTTTLETEKSGRWREV